MTTSGIYSTYCIRNGQNSSLQHEIQTSNEYQPPTECILLRAVAATAVGVTTAVRPGEWRPRAGAYPAGDSIRPTQGCSLVARSVD